MKVNRCATLLSTLVVVCFVPPANAADRMRAGQWVGTTIAGGRTFHTSSCISQSDAAAMNGDARSVLNYLQKIIPPEICRITDVKVGGSQVVYTSTCGGRTPQVVTTSYHGDSSEGTDNTGSTKTQARLVGACK